MTSVCVQDRSRPGLRLPLPAWAGVPGRSGNTIPVPDIDVRGAGVAVHADPVGAGPTATPTPRPSTPTASPTTAPTTPSSPPGITSVTINRSGVRCTVTAVDTTAGRGLSARLALALAAATVPTAGAAVYDARTGTYCGVRDQQLFYAASIDKATSVSALLWQHQRADTGLTAEEKDWARRAITVSDNAAQTALWRRAGGAAGVRAFLRAAGMTHTVTDPAGGWGLTRTTAADQVTLLNQLAHGPLLTPANRSYLLGLMRAVTASQRWGVPVGAPRTDSVANKNGWLPHCGSWRVNSIGYVQGPGPAPTDDYTLALLSAGSRTLTAGQRTLNTIARAVHATV